MAAMTSGENQQLMLRVKEVTKKGAYKSEDNQFRIQCMTVDNG